MLSFVNDYCENAHEKILTRLLDGARVKNPGYGEDEICRSAAEKIRLACKCPDAQVRFLVGGTQTNQLVIDTCTEAYEGVIACSSGHVNVHEAGAIEFTGHKVLTLPEHDGKIDAGELEVLIKTFYADGNYEHMVFPGIVYISHPTEIGTLYTKKELTDLSRICREYDIPLFLDGARLAYALACADMGLSDVTLEDIAKLCDVFYIGGTKCGALFGEAVVFTHGNMPKRFVTRIKQHGALLAKGWLLGVMFDTLFTDGLYYELGHNAIERAIELRAALREKGYQLLFDTPTNQIMVVLENSRKAELAKKVNFSFWENIDENHTAIRFCTSWATAKEDVKKLIEIL